MWKLDIPGEVTLEKSFYFVVNATGPSLPYIAETNTACYLSNDSLLIGQGYVSTCQVYNILNSGNAVTLVYLIKNLVGTCKGTIYIHHYGIRQHSSNVRVNPMLYARLDTAAIQPMFDKDIILKS